MLIKIVAAHFYFKQTIWPRLKRLTSLNCSQVGSIEPSSLIPDLVKCVLDEPHELRRGPVCSGRERGLQCRWERVWELEQHGKVPSCSWCDLQTDIRPAFIQSLCLCPHWPTNLWPHWWDGRPAAELCSLELGKKRNGRTEAHERISDWLLSAVHERYVIGPDVSMNDPQWAQMLRGSNHLPKNRFTVWNEKTFQDRPHLMLVEED